MTLDEAIKHCEDVISEQKSCNKTGCAEDHIQLRDWLIELKKYKSADIPLTEEFKRYTIEDGKKFFYDIIDLGKRLQYEELGLMHLFNIYLEIITHKNAKISCDYLHRMNPFDKSSYGYSKVLNTELNNTDISFNGLLHILYSLPERDPDFKKAERNYYDVEYPKRYQEDRLRNIDIEKEKFRRENKRKPNKKDMEEIIHSVEYNMSRFHHPGTLTPNLYPELNCVEVIVGEEKNDPELVEFTNWLKSFNPLCPIQRLPSGKVKEYRSLSLSDWKFYMKNEN